MTDKRHTYAIASEKGRRTTRPFCYSFWNCDVEMHIVKNGIIVCFNRPKYIEHDLILKDSMVKDALKKAAMLHLIKYGYFFSYDTLRATIDDQTRFIYSSDKEGNSLLYYLIENQLQSKMPDSWMLDPVISTILNTAKSNYDRRFSALFALITAKGKRNITERFIYLWMSVNALYGFMAQIHPSHPKREVAQLSIIAKYNGCKYIGGNELEKRRCLAKILDYLDTISAEMLSRIKEDVEANDWKGTHLTEIKNIVDETLGIGKIDPKGLFNFWIPYQLRCKYFHGEKELPLLCFAEERPLPALKWISSFLEEFLDKELVKWFDETELHNRLIPRLEYLMV